MKNKTSILLFIKVPPPITGATLMNQRINNSALINSTFNIRTIPISYTSKLNDLGKWQIRKFLRIIIITFKLLNELIFHRPNLIYFQLSPLKFSFIRDFCYVFFMKLFMVKIVYHIHGQGINKASANKLIKKMYKYAFKKSDVICLSHLLTYDLKNVFSGKIHIVNNGIPDLNPEKEFRTNKHEKPIQLLFLSNLIISKGILVFIDAIEGLVNNNISFHANIVGASGTLLSEALEELIIKKGLSKHVSYLGAQYGDEKKNILKNSDVMVFPTMNDAFPGVVIDAMQFGLPVISTVEGAIPDIVDDNITGFLIDKENPQQIIDKIITLNDNRDLIIKMGNAGRKKFEQKYLFSIFEQNMIEVFQTIITQ